MANFKFTPPPKWTAEEINLIKTLYLSLGPAALSKQLPGRSIDAVRHRGNSLGLNLKLNGIAPKQLVNPACPEWSETEIAILREHYPEGGSAAVAKLIDRSVHGIRRKATKLDVLTRKLIRPKASSIRLTVKAALADRAEHGYISPARVGVVVGLTRRTVNRYLREAGIAADHPRMGGKICGKAKAKAEGKDEVETVRLNGTDRGVMPGNGPDCLALTLKGDRSSDSSRNLDHSTTGLSGVRNDIAPPVSSPVARILALLPANLDTLPPSLRRRWAEWAADCRRNRCSREVNPTPAEIDRLAAIELAKRLKAKAEQNGGENHTPSVRFLKSINGSCLLWWSGQAMNKGRAS